VKKVSQIFAAIAILALALAAAPTPLRVVEAANPPSSGTVTPNKSSELRISATFSHVVAADDNRLLEVAVMIRANEWVSSVTYGGDPLTLAKVQDGGDSEDQRVELWYLVNPPVGTEDVVVNFASYVNPSGVYAVNFTGVDQASPIGATAGASATSGTDATTQITTLNADSLIFGAVSARGGNTNPFTTNLPVTALWDDNTGGASSEDDGLWGGKEDASDAGIYTFNTQLNSASHWAIACLELKSWSPPSFIDIIPDKDAYKDGDTISLEVTLDNHNTGCDLTADFSQIDDQYVTGEEDVVNWGTDEVDNNDDGHVDEPAEQGVYVIIYLISAVNGKSDGSYSVPVTAVDGAGNSATDSNTSLTLDNTPPSAPTNLSAVALTEGGIKLSWTASSSGDVAQYNIYKATSSGGQNYSNPTYTVSTGTTTYTDTSTTDGQTYYYVVRAQDAAGNIETNTNEVSATASGTGPPPPTNLTATAIAGGSIQLSWTASSPETNVAQYNIYRATSSGGQDYSSPTYTVSVGTTTYTDTSTTDGQTYYYVVRAQDSIGNIETNTNEVSATASATGPSFSSISADKSAYKDGDTTTLTVTLANHNTGCTLTADFSNIDDQYVTGGETVENWGTDGVDNNGDGHIDEPAEQGVYIISYLISGVNGKSDGSYSVPVTATDGAENSASSSITLTLDNTTDLTLGTVSEAYIAYGGQTLYDLRSSTDDDNPTVFANSKIDEIHLVLDLYSGIELNESASGISLFKMVDETWEEVSGSPEVDQEAGRVEMVFHLDPVFDPARDNHSKDGKYRVKAVLESTTGASDELNFYFIYDTISPELPDFGITSFNSSTGRINVSGTTRDDASDPQEVEIFLNGESQGTVTADGAGHFSKDNISLVSGDNFITVQSSDKAGNKSSLSGSLHLKYNPQSLLSLVIRSSHVVRSGSATIPVKIIYSVTQPAQVTIHIYNLHGEIVKEWSEWVSPGEEPEWSWSGENMYGEVVNNGVYILKVSADDGGGRRENVTKLLGVLR